ncbi:hypothetical protein GCM10023317_63150 [Actinopolymorpha pittospori]|nr:class F sortase [Actinopolymorpha pittospori]
MGRAPDKVTSEAGGRRGKPRRAVGFSLVALLAIAGIALLVLAYSPAQRPQLPAGDAAPAFLRSPSPTPSDANRGSLPAPSGGSGQGASGKPTPAPTGLPASEPVSLSIPRIGVETTLMQLGMNDDGTAAVPTPEEADHAGWYKFTVTPGEVGNSVIAGHVDSAVLGPAVFFRLGELKPGDVVHIVREDKSEVTYTVDGVKAYPKEQFPTELVWGPSDKSTLRLVTCGGPWSKETSYRDNVIVFATRTDPPQ